MFERSQLFVRVCSRKPDEVLRACHPDVRTPLQCDVWASPMSGFGNAMSEKKSPRPRRSAEETRELMVQHGLRQLESDGVEIGLDHLTLEDARLAADVPRSSSHSAWSINEEWTPQEPSQRAVVERWFSVRQDRLFADASTQAIQRYLREADGNLSSKAIMRVAVQAAVDEASTEDENGQRNGFLSTDMALRHALASQPDARRDAEVLGWAQAGERANQAKRIVNNYKPLGEFLGLRPRPEFGDDAYQYLAVAIASIVEGVSLRHVLFPESGLADSAVLDEDPDHGPATLACICVEALTERFFEPDPGHKAH